MLDNRRKFVESARARGDYFTLALMKTAIIQTECEDVPTACVSVRKNGQPVIQIGTEMSHYPFPAFEVVLTHELRHILRYYITITIDPVYLTRAYI